MRTPELSFCIPVKNRLSDIQATLATNLDHNRSSYDAVEFIVVCFDSDTEVEDWIKRTFPNDLATEYLRFYRRHDLPQWHFGKAKSAFKKLIRGNIYASLDADNFTGPDAGAHIVRVFQEHSYKCVFHQFQGDWGDGTCGRIALSRNDYIDYGYEERLTPRQWDELDALLTVLVRRPDRCYVHYKNRSILTKSHPFARFFVNEGVWPRTSDVRPELDPLFDGQAKVAVGQQDSDYVNNEPRLKYQSCLNHLFSFVKNTNHERCRLEYVSELVDLQREMVEAIDAEVLEGWFLGRKPPQGGPTRTGGVTLVSCVRDEPHLMDWYEYYKRLGVDRFLIVDDGSASPVENVLPYSDVFVWRPTAGSFRYAKALWLEILMSTYCEGQWCLTVDSDEYVSLPETSPAGSQAEGAGWPLDATRKWAEKNQVTYFAGVLVDMFPEPRKSTVGLRGVNDYVNFQFRPSTLAGWYAQHNTARWSYGEHCEWAYKVDIRYRLNQTVDSLRKFPLFQYRSGVHINQGFHDLIIDGQKRSADDLARADLIPILHYKLYQMDLTSGSFRERPTGEYHSETQQNIKKLRENIAEKTEVAAKSPFRYRYIAYEVFPVPSSHVVRVIREPAEDGKNFERRLVRKCIVWRPASVAPRLRDGVVEAEDLHSAVRWLEQRIPYRLASIGGEELSGGNGESADLVRVDLLEKNTRKTMNS